MWITGKIQEVKQVLTVRDKMEFEGDVTHDF